MGADTASGAMEGLKKSPSHNDVMLNKGVWSSYHWGSVGAAHLHNGDNHFASLWFAVEKDDSTC